MEGAEVRVSDWPLTLTPFPKNGVLGTHSSVHSQAGWMGLLTNSLFTTSTAWGTASLGLYIPVFLGVAARVFKMSTMNGATLGGNTDIGIYNERGTRLVSSAPTAQAGISTIQTFDITDTLLAPGIYYLALANTTTTATYLCSPSAAIRLRACGCLEQTGLSSGTLPATATFATWTRAFCPVVVAHYESVV